MVFQIIHILIVMCNLTLRAYTLLSRQHQLYGLWLAHAITIPIGVLVFPLGYFLSFYPIKDFVHKNYWRIANRVTFATMGLNLQGKHKYHQGRQ